MTYFGYLATTTLATSSGERRFIVVSHAVGAIANVGLLLALAPSEGLLGAAVACGVGLAITNLALTVRCALFLRRVR